MLTLGVWILVAWFVGIPLALWALYAIDRVLAKFLEGVSDFIDAMLTPFTAEGRARMREEARAVREAGKAEAEAAKAHKSSPSDMKLAWALGLGPWVFLVGTFVWVTVGSALGFYHPS